MESISSEIGTGSLGSFRHDLPPVREDRQCASSFESGSPEVRVVTKLSTKTVLAVTAVCAIYFAQLISLVGAGAQGQTIAAHFHDTANVSWLSAPITILTVVLGPIVSQAADYWGRRWFLILLTLIGAAGSVTVARASSMDMAISGFCLIGTAFGVQPLLHAVISEVLPRRWRAHGQAAVMGSNGLGSITALLAGGALNRTNAAAGNGFRIYFYMATGWFVLAAILCLAAYRPPPTFHQQKFTTHMERLRQLDWIGYLLMGGGLVLFCIGLSWSKSPYPWSNARVSATFTIGLALGLGLVVYETRYKKDGMFHHGLFKGNRNFSIALFCVFAEGVAFFAANTYFTFQVNELYEKDALLVGARYSIMLICSMIGAGLTGVYCAIKCRVRWVTVLAFVIFIIFFIGMATTNRYTDQPVWGYPVLLGFALGMTLTTLVTIAQLSTPPHLISIASGLTISIRSLGGTVGIAVYNTLFTDQLHKLTPKLTQVALAQGLGRDHIRRFVYAIKDQNKTVLTNIPGITEAMIREGQVVFKDTYVLAFRNVWIAAGCFVVLAAVASVFLHDKETEFNMEIDAPVEHPTTDKGSLS